MMNYRIVRKAGKKLRDPFSDGDTKSIAGSLLSLYRHYGDINNPGRSIIDACIDKYKSVMIGNLNSACVVKGKRFVDNVIPCVGQYSI